MSRALELTSLVRDVMVSEHGYKLDVRELSVTLAEAISRVPCGTKYYTGGSHFFNPAPLSAPGLSQRHLTRTLGLKEVNIKSVYSI